MLAHLRRSWETAAETVHSRSRSRGARKWTKEDEGRSTSTAGKEKQESDETGWLTSRPD